MHLPGLKEGAAFRAWRWRPDSFQAQRLLLVLAEQGGAELSLLGFDLLQRLTFEQGANISERRILVALATELGLLDPVTFFRSKSHHRTTLNAFAESKRVLGDITAPVMRFTSTAHPNMGTISVTGSEGINGILTAISDFVLALHRRQGREAPAGFKETFRETLWLVPRLQVENPKYQGLDMPNEYEMQA